MKRRVRPPALPGSGGGVLQEAEQAVKYIGITGPTGAGKTTALHELEALGALVIDADQVYHQLLEGSAPLRQALTQAFGEGILDASGRLDRKALGRQVFGNSAALARLNAITHPFVGAEIDRLAGEAEAAGRTAVAIDAIALIESGVSERCDVVVGVLAPAEVRVARIMAREGIPEDYARRRVAAQQGEEFYRAHCTYILENSGDDPQAFRQQARALFTALLEQGESHR